MNKNIPAIGIILLLIGVSILPSISGNIKIINKVVNEDVTNDRIEDMHGLKYDDRGYIINNQLVREEVSLVNTYNNGPGEINPIWITIENLGYICSMKAYEDYIYVVGYKYYSEEENYSALLAKFDITDGELIWIKTWEGFHPFTWALDLEVYNNYIYVVGYTGPSGSIKFWMDSFICKYDLDGNLLWSKLINETKFDNTDGIKEHDNYLYLCGFKDSDSWILKYDTNGNKIWGKTYKIQGTSESHFYDLEIYNGFIYAEGQTDSHDKTRQDVLVVKISLDGELIWNREWGGKGPQLGTGIDVEDGYIYVCSYHNLLKYDTDGNLQWDAGSGTRSSLLDIKVFNGSIYTTGEIWGLYPYDQLWDVVLQNHDDTNGKLIWYLTYGGNSIDRGRCIETYNNSFYLCGICYDKDFILNYDVDLFSDNNKPDKPSKPFGQVNGVPGVEYDYNTSTTDPDGDLISYCFSWGDGEKNNTITKWMNSGETVTASHSWSERGKYKVKVRARDECGFVSDWSDPLEVTMPKNKQATHKITFSKFFERLMNSFSLLERLPNTR